MSLENLMTSSPSTEQPSSKTDQVPTSDQQVTPSQTAEKPQVPQDADPLNFGRKFSALSRKEKELREMRKQIDEERKSFQESANQYNEFKRKLKLNPTEALKEAGVDLDYLTNVHLSGGQVPENVKISTVVEDLQAEIKALRAQVDGSKPKDEEQQSEVDPDDESNWTPEQKVAVQEFKQGMYEYLEEQSKSYPLIHEQEAGEVVFHAINELYKQSALQGKPRIPSYEEAASKVEQWLKSEIVRLHGQVQAPAESQGKDSQEVKSSGSSTSPTLSNQHSTSRPTEVKPSKLLSREEALARAASLLRTK